MPQDPSILASMGQNSFAPDFSGPFSGIIQAGLTPPQQNAQQQQAPYTGGSKLGNIAFIGEKFLEGFQRGRLMSYASQEADKARKFKAGMALTQSAIDNAPEELKARARELQSNWVLASMQDAVDGDGKGGQQKQGKQAKKPKRQSDQKDEYGQSKSGQPEPPHEIVRSTMSKVLSHLAGPNLPKTSVGDLKELQANLAPILGASTIASRAADQVGNVSTAVSVYRREHPDATEEQLRNLPEVQKAGMELIRMGHAPAQVDGFIKQGIGAAHTEAENLNLRIGRTSAESGETALKQQKTILGLEEKASKELDATEAPPETRQLGGSGAYFYAPQGSPQAKPTSPSLVPVPESQKTPQEKAADQYSPGEIRSFVGRPVTEVPGEKSKIVWAKSPTGEVMSLQTITLPQTGKYYTADANHRRINVMSAESQGWKFETSRPIPVPNAEYKLVPSKDGKGYDYWEIDRATGKPQPVMDPRDPKKPLKAKLDTESDKQIRRTEAAIHRIVATKDSKDLSIKSRYDGLKNNFLLQAHSQGISPDDQTKRINELDQQMNQALESNLRAANIEAQLYKRDAPLLSDPFGVEQPQQAPSNPNFNPGDAGNWFFQDQQ